MKEICFCYINRIWHNFINALRVYFVLYLEHRFRWSLYTRKRRL